MEWVTNQNAYFYTAGNRLEPETRRGEVNKTQEAESISSNLLVGEFLPLVDYITKPGFTNTAFCTSFNSLGSLNRTNEFVMKISKEVFRKLKNSVSSVKIINNY